MDATTTNAAAPCARPGCGHAATNHSDLAGCTAQIGANYCTCLTYLAPALTPYDGGTSSGHSGTDTSRQRAERMDADGTTAKVQDEVLGYVAASKRDGATIAELRLAYPRQHHGTLSGTLTRLHQAGLLKRLTERRGRCAVYVTPSNVDGRDVEGAGRKAAAQAIDPAQVAAAIVLLRQMADERQRPDGPVARQARRVADRLDAQR